MRSGAMGNPSRGQPTVRCAARRVATAGERGGSRRDGESQRGPGSPPARNPVDEGLGPGAGKNLLSLQHFRVLGCLEALAARTSAVSLELVSALLQLAPPTLSRIVSDLERAGLRVLGRGR